MIESLIWFVVHVTISCNQNFYSCEYINQHGTHMRGFVSAINRQSQARALMISKKCGYSSVQWAPCAVYFLPPVESCKIRAVSNTQKQKTRIIRVKLYLKAHCSDTNWLPDPVFDKQKPRQNFVPKEKLLRIII